MEPNGRLVRTDTGWKCPACGFKLSLFLDQEIVAQAMHQLHSPPCFSGSLLGETQQIVSEIGSVSRPGHLESDAVIGWSASRLDQRHQSSLMQPFAGVQCSEGASSVADLWPAPRWSDMMTTAELQRGAVSSQQSDPFPHAPDFNSGQQLDSDAVVYRRDIPEVGERREALDQQPTGSRIEQGIRVIKALQCAVCLVKWRSIATTQCRHLGCCETCFPRTSANCVVCREIVVNSFPVEFHSSKLLEGLEIPFLLTMTIGRDDLQVYLDMGFTESRVKRAIHLIQQQNNSEELPAVDSVVDFMVDNPYPVPSAEEMELLLTDPTVNDTVKSRLCHYLEAISKCMMCRCNVPSICLMPCKHLALCRKCFERQPRLKKCPECGKPIKNQVAVYLP